MIVENFPKPFSLILVAFIPSPRDLNICRVLGWYRIPLRTAPKVISVDYIAFYQPSTFEENKWRIETLAQVKGHELVTRSELIRDELEHSESNEAYFKIQLGPLITLPKPIIADKWKRITFFYTTGQYLLSAKTISDLVVPSEERKMLWQSLRERADIDQHYDEQEIVISPDIIHSLFGISEMNENNETGSKHNQK